MMNPDNYEIEMEKLEDFLQKASDSPVQDKNTFLLPALRKSQELFSCVPEFVVKRVSSAFNVSKDEVTKIISAYPYLTEGVVADTRISMCCGPVCYRKGIMDVHETIRERLHIKDEEDTTEDNKVSVKITNCKGLCRQAPVATVNSKPYYNVEVEPFCSLITNKLKS